MAMSSSVPPPPEMRAGQRYAAAGAAELERTIFKPYSELFTNKEPESDDPAVRSLDHSERALNLSNTFSIIICKLSSTPCLSRPLHYLYPALSRGAAAAASRMAAAAAGGMASRAASRPGTGAYAGGDGRMWDGTWPGV
jgi:hypothetical protein